ncbi:HlyD family type I secretion periplasmic adaptor subunit [Enterovirga sp. CN4-39]|uniref:HlyD family type I secretion periplasmic adaptor subunit n=1 Tax=Enterovirga sp. CN4-39 TaxID=3400910 RepID=UPI003C0907D9
MQEGEPPAARWVLRTIVAFVFTLIALSAVMRLDRVVTSIGGEVTGVEPNLVLQVLEDSIIRSLLVKEGDVVTGGQLLAKLDPTFTTADVNQLEVQVAAANAQIARLEAERAGRDFQMESAGAGTDALNGYIALQRSLYVQRKSQFQAQQRSFDEKIALTKATMDKTREDERQLTDRLAIFKEIEAMRTALEASKITSRLQLLQSTDQRIEIERNLELSRNSLRESGHQLQALISDREAFNQQWLAQVGQELVTASQSRDAALEQLAKAKRRQDLVVMTAPENGIVLRLAKVSQGSILKAGEQLMQIVPTRAPLEAEVKVAAGDIGFIRPGDRCVIKLDPFNFVEHGWAEGRLRWISEGVFTTDADGRPAPAYYKARVTIDDLQLKNLPESARLIPGMQLNADIHVGTRTVLAYFFHGLIRQFGEAMRER